MKQETPEMFLVQFVDKRGRPIAIRIYKSGNLAYSFDVYDTSQGEVPLPPTTRQQNHLGYARVYIDETLGKDTVRIHLQDIELNEKYRQAGIARHILEQVKQLAQQHNATSIYGVIENQEARKFWEHQVKGGWYIVSSGGCYGTVKYDLRSSEKDTSTDCNTKVSSDESSFAKNFQRTPPLQQDSVEKHAMTQKESKTQDSRFGCDRIIIWIIIGGLVITGVVIFLYFVYILLLAIWIKSITG